MTQDELRKFSVNIAVCRANDCDIPPVHQARIDDVFHRIIAASEPGLCCRECGRPVKVVAYETRPPGWEGIFGVSRKVFLGYVCLCSDHELWESLTGKRVRV